jgi:hypothetical protein
VIEVRKPGVAKNSLNLGTAVFRPEPEGGGDMAPPLSLASAPRVVTRAVWLAGLTSSIFHHAGEGDRDRTELHRNLPL